MGSGRERMRPIRDLSTAELLQRTVLDGVSPHAVLAGLGASSGLVVLSGRWCGGGVVITRDPVAVASDPAILDLAATGVADPRDGVGGGWFGWLAYPQRSQERSHWLGLYPNVLRYSKRDNRWIDEALGGVVEEQHLERRRERLVQEIQRCQRRSAAHARGYRVGPMRANLSAGEYTAAVEKCIQSIRAGDIYQANVCMRLESEFYGDAGALFSDVVNRLQPAYAALVCTPEAVVVSLSPELFLHRAGRLVTSAPIKGTRPRRAGEDDEGQAVQLLRSEKERAENVMIVDLVRNDLARVAEVGSVSVPSLLEVEPHCGVWHLVSRVSAEIADGTTGSDLLDATFPPGSVTGAPKLSARTVIDYVEAVPRGVYTGAVGYVSPVGGLEMNVAIRTLEISNDSGGKKRMLLGVGAGITASSIPILEWWECLDKASPLATAMGTTVIAESPVRDDDSAVDRAGVVEVMLVVDGEIVDMDDHLDRLRASLCDLWGRELPASARHELLACADRAPRPVARLHAEVTRGHGEVSLAMRTSLQMRPAPLACQVGARLSIATMPHGLGRHKWSDRRLVDDLELRHRGRQILIVDSDDRCLETSRGNLLAFRGSRMITPPLDGRILPGVARRAVIDLASAAGLGVEIRDIRLEEMPEFDGLAVCNSLTGVEWVRRCPVALWRQPTPQMTALSSAILERWGVTGSPDTRLVSQLEQAI